MISFIVPAYNVSKTITKAISSILNQKETKLSYEIIIVNDGSTDNLDQVLEEYLKQKNNEDKNKIKYFKKENGGLSDARNYGMSRAQGDYFIFVDSDDYISDTLLKDIEKYINQKIDLIKWSPKIVDEQENIIEVKSTVPFDITTGEQGFNQLFGKDDLLVTVWSYAIKKDIMMQFPKNKYHEDFAIMPLVILRAKTMVAIDKNEYYYVQTQNSIMRNQDSEKQRKKINDILENYDNLIIKIEEMQIEKNTKENLKIFISNSLFVVEKDLKGENKKYFQEELKARKIAKNIKVRNFKQFIKRIILEIKY